MAYGACNDCGNSYSECECRERERVKREEAEQERRAREWEQMKPPCDFGEVRKLIRIARRKSRSFDG